MGHLLHVVFSFLMEPLATIVMNLYFAFNLLYKYLLQPLMDGNVSSQVICVTISLTVLLGILASILYFLDRCLISTREEVLKYALKLENVKFINSKVEAGNKKQELIVEENELMFSMRNLKEDK